MAIDQSAIANLFKTPAKSAAAPQAAAAVAQGAPWSLSSARALLAAVGPCDVDDKYQAAKGCKATCNGWPVTIQNGRMVSLQHAVRDASGAYAFCKAAILDAGR